MIALLDAQTLWYVTRATGLVSLVLLTATVVLGIAETLRWATDRWPRFVTAGLHKNISLLATTFIAAHVVTAIVDGFAPIGWLDVVVPWGSAYRPLWLGFGTVAVDLLIALVVTSLLRRRIGRRAWRAVHWCAYACWPVALLHGLGTGSDTSITWSLAVEGLCVSAVVVAIWWRIVSGWPTHTSRRIVAASASAVVPIGIALWTFAGPLQPGWARRAGTPEALLANSNTVAASQARSVVDPPMASAFDASADGTIEETPRREHAGTVVTISLQLTGDATGSARLVLQGNALDRGGISLEAGRVALLLGNDPVPYSGGVSTLSGSVIGAAVAQPDGAAFDVEFDLSIDDGQVSGTVSGAPK